MPLEELIKDTKFWAGINSADTDSYPVEDIIRNYNFNLDLGILKAMRQSGSWQVDDSTYNNIQIGYNHLAAGQDNYTLGSEMVKVQRLRIKDKNGAWKTLIPKDRWELSDSILNSVGTPEYYDKLGESLMLYPTPDYSSNNGIELQFIRSARYLSSDDLTIVPGLPVPILRWLSLRGSLDYTETNEMESRSNKIVRRLKELDEEAKEMYSQRDGDDMVNISIKRDNGFVDNLYQ